MKRRGFTIVELLLAMAAVAVLLVVITMLVMNINSLYRKGIALREVNAAARAVIDDMTRTINSSPGRPGPAAGATRTLADGGVFCTGSYSYVWKHATANRAGGTNIRVAGGNNTAFRLMKIRDGGRTLCAGAAGGTVTFTVADARDAAELLSSAEINLALYDFRVYQPVVAAPTGLAAVYARQTFYSVTFVMGTMEGIDLDLSTGRIGGRACVPPEDVGGLNFDYCAANKFNFAVRASGGV
jgi:prepilin-type N-terminal cleavage/methylation domain-containing protein